MQILMVNRTIIKPISISYDAMVRVENLIFPADFVILDCKVDFEMSISLERSFMDTRRAMVDMEIR